MTFIRSLLFNIYLFGGTGIIALVLLLLMPFSREEMRKGSQFWTRYVMWGMKVITGIEYEIRGLEHLPNNGAIIACKHQSAWDTAVFVMLRISTAYILKKELLNIPFYGWYVKRAGHIAVDRSAGPAHLKAWLLMLRPPLKKAATWLFSRKAHAQHQVSPVTTNQASLPSIPRPNNQSYRWL